MSASADAMDGGSGGGQRQRAGFGVSYVLSTLLVGYGLGGQARWCWAEVINGGSMSRQRR